MITWGLLLFVGLRLVVAFLNLAGRVNLPRGKKLSGLPRISILIPARNEAHTIGALLSDLSSLTYTDYEVIVYNDCSTDRTAQVVSRFLKADKRITLLNGEKLPSGWLGKNYACHTLAKSATGDFLLFLDADVRIGKDLLQRVVGAADKQGCDLLSIFPRQVMDNKGVWQVTPLMNWILLSLLVLLLVRLSRNPAFSAANGQFMFFRTNTYRKLLPHQYLRNSRVEDIGICRYYKKQKQKVATILGDNDIRCHMYGSREEAINGFSKNIFAFFGNSLILTLLFAIITTLAPFVIFYQMGVGAGTLYLVAIILIRICVSVASRQNVATNLLYLPLQHYNFLVIIYKSIIYRRNKTLVWKGRNVSDSR